jgi:stearoyl-CoA desaturase (delta-9 desaturase)
MELPDGLQDLLRTLELWKLLQPPKRGGQADDTSLPAAANAPLRRSVYTLLRCLITKREDWTDRSLADSIGPTILRSIWLEEDSSVWSGGVVGEAIALFLTKFRRVWLAVVAPVDSIEGAPKDEDGSSEDSDEDESEGDDEEAMGTSEEQLVLSPPPGQDTYSSFLGFLQRGCNGQAIEAYPLVLVILSTIPEEVRSVRESGVVIPC